MAIVKWMCFVVLATFGILAAPGAAEALSIFTTPEEIDGVPQPAVENPNTDTLLRATTTFDQVGNVLTVTLQNRSDAAQGGSDLLGAVYFNITGNPTLTTGTATAEDVLYGSTARAKSGNTSYTYGDGTTIGTAIKTYIDTGNVAPEWAYVGGLNKTLPSPGNVILYPASSSVTVQYGISSVGLGWFPSANRFDTSIDLDNPPEPDGSNFAIMSNAGIGSKGQGLVNDPLIQDTATFTFTLASPNAVTITDVWFQFGTGLTEPQLVGYVPGFGDNPPVVPEPVTMAGVCLGLCGLAGYVRRRR